MLEELSIGGYDEIFRVGPIGARRSQNGKLAALSNLKKLELHGATTCIKFPPKYFGDTVVDLYLNLDYEISNEMLKCIQNFHRLQTLDLKLYSQRQDDSYDPPSMSKIRTLFSILRSVQSGSALHSLSLALHPDYNPNSYHVDRSGLLDLLVGSDMLKVLNGFPSLSHLSFRLWENDGAYDAVWWKQEMVRRLPSHLHAVTIELYTFTGERDLWLTEDEMTTRRAQKNTDHIATIDSVSDPSSSLPQLDSSVSYGGVRRKILDAGGYTAYRVDFDLESENLGVTECDEPHLEQPTQLSDIPTILKLHPIDPFHD